MTIHHSTDFRFRSVLRISRSQWESTPGAIRPLVKSSQELPYRELNIIRCSIFTDWTTNLTSSNIFCPNANFLHYKWSLVHFTSYCCKLYRPTRHAFHDGSFSDRSFNDWSFNDGSFSERSFNERSFSKGHSVTDHLMTGHSMTGHSVIGHSMKGHSVKGHSVTDHSMTGHSMMGHSMKSHSMMFTYNVKRQP